MDPDEELYLRAGLIATMGEDLWKLGRRPNWERLQRILAAILARESFFVGDDDSQQLVDHVRRRFDLSRESDGNSIVTRILLQDSGTNEQREKMAEVMKAVLSAGINPDLPATNGWRPSHVVGSFALLELVPVLFTCRPDMSAVNNNRDTPLGAALSDYVSFAVERTNSM